jgi:hypothetical protein
MSDNDAAVKPSDDWKTGNEPETAAQRSYLETCPGKQVRYSRDR